ncbi:hypothetical protein AMK19_26755 [Kitasatospora sp. CB01950]|nr:hypothetical protein AMK19_26755 [Kitasatospora sp. CB01950]
MDAFAALERRIWAASAGGYAASVARLCAHTVPAPAERVVAVDAEPAVAAEAGRMVPEAIVAALPELSFAERAFDVVMGNFVLHHVGRPAVAPAELRRVLRPGGRPGLTAWAAPAPPGQSLLARAFEAAGAVRPADLPSPPAAPAAVTEVEGFRALLADSGFGAVDGRVVRWDHRTSVEAWWGGPAGGVAFLGELLRRRSPEVRVGVRREFERPTGEFMRVEGELALPHAAVLVSARR